MKKSQKNHTLIFLNLKNKCLNIHPNSCLPFTVLSQLRENTKYKK